MNIRRKRLLTLLLVLGMAALGVASWSQTARAEENENGEADPGTGIETTRVIRDDLHNQYGIVLYKEGQLSCTDAGVTFSHDKKSDSLLISGKYAALKKARFVIDKDYDFGDKVIGRFSLDLIAGKKQHITLGFYLDDETEPFAAVDLKRQRKEEDWTYQRNISLDVYDRKITGRHRLSFGVLENEKSEKNLTFAFQAVEFVESSVPVVYFNLDETEGTVAEMNASGDHSVECYGSMDIRVPEDYVSEYGPVAVGRQTYELDYIRGRGNSTWIAGKKPYKVKLEKKADLLGMGKQKHWVLLANYYDNSLLRNKATYWLGEEINKRIPEAYEYTPASVAVDVVMNGEYYGSYYLAEQIRLGENRVDLNNLEDTPDAVDPAAITGGYLLSVEPYGDEDKATLETDRGRTFLIESPDFSLQLNQAQYDYIKGYVQDVEDGIFDSEFKNGKGVRYQDLMDIRSAAYYYLMQEFSMNGDGFISTSTYLYKKPDTFNEDGSLKEAGKLYWGPLWDFDFVAWGSTEYQETFTEGWTQQEAIWFERMFCDKEFTGVLVREAWPELKNQLEALIADGGQLDQYYAKVESSAGYNFEHLGFSPLDYDYDDDHTPATLTYSEELTRFKKWIRDRITWVDANIESLLPQDCVITFPGTNIKTRIGVQGRVYTGMPAAPKKKGFTFTGWKLKYHYTLEEYLKVNGMTYKQLVEWFGKDYAEKIKKEGYNDSCRFKNGQALPVAASVKAYPVYSDNAKLVKPRELYFTRKNYNLCLNDYEYDDTETLGLGVVPFNVNRDILQWSTSDPSVLTVENGRVFVKKPGTARVTVKAFNGVSASCQVRVYSEEEADEMDYEDYYTQSFRLPYKQVSMNVGEFRPLAPIASPATAVYETVSVYCTDDSILKQDEGHVFKALKEGTCYIYCVYDETLSLCKVIVKDPKKLVKNEKFTRKGLNYRVNSLKNLTVTCTGPADKKMEKVVIPGSLTYKGKKLKVTSIKAGAFKDMKKLTSVVVGQNVKSICNEAFSNCRRLKTVTLGQRVASEGNQAFYNCTGLKTLRIKAAPHKTYSKVYGKTKADVKVYVPKKWLDYYKSFFKRKKVIGKF